MYERFVRCLAWLTVLASVGCGRVGVDLLGGQVCVAGTCAADVDRCPADETKNSPGICGCGVSDQADGDADGTPDCNDLCAGARDRLAKGMCGCEAASRDDDGDNAANCQDECPHDPFKQLAGLCGCGIADADRDGDGMPDCADACPDDAAKVVAGQCGCGVEESDRDVDHDGRLDCLFPCNGVDDARYRPDTSCGAGYCQLTNIPSSCSSGVETLCQPGAPLTTTDATCDGVDDDCDGIVDDDFPSYSTSCGAGACAGAGAMICSNGALQDTCAPRVPAASDLTCDGFDDDCDDSLDEDYLPVATTCGVGACVRSGTALCVSGAPQSDCVPGAPATNDATCNGIDEDCSGAADEDYVAPAISCGVGVCRATGAIMCREGVTVNVCTPGAATSMVDGPAANGLDDDCDGQVDEDACIATPQSYGPGTYTNFTPPPRCGSITVELWGAGGGSGGQTSVGETGNPGAGGPGGYVRHTLPLSGAVTLYVGNGGQGCGAGGSNPGATTYNGGAGGELGNNGTAGADRMVADGGAGGTPDGPGAGGRGHFGGGGGGSGSLTPVPPYPGAGGGGGAATVLLVGGNPVLVAGGGGGGGGTNGTSVTSNGGAGGSGCGANGGVASGSILAGGGGGGGGICSGPAGSTNTRGTGTTPANNTLLPNGRAAGAQGVCGGGGSGYAIVTFAP